LNQEQEVQKNVLKIPKIKIIQKKERKKIIPKSSKKILKNPKKNYLF
jgi:hypothetical protein